MDHLAAGRPRGDEGPHAPGPGPWWAERWWFCWGGPAPADGGGFTELVLLPNQRVAWYRAALVRAGRPLLAVVDHDAPLPRVGLELRGSGLWADHAVEAPFAQWTVANEAFALAVDDPDELAGRAYGTPVPLAFDVEWYAAGPVTSHAGGPGDLADGYGQVGDVEGVADLGGGDRVTVRGPAWRRHEWGTLTLPGVDGTAGDDGWAVVPDRWPVPFAVVVDDVLGPAGWRRRRRVG